MRKTIVLFLSALLLLSACGEQPGTSETPPAETGTAVSRTPAPTAAFESPVPTVRVTAPLSPPPATGAPVETPAPPPPGTEPPADTPEPPPPPEITEEPPPPEDPPEPAPDETAAWTPEPQPTEEEAPPPDSPDAAFADAAFFGNSLVEGLGKFGDLQQGEFFAQESASVINVDRIKSAALSDGEEATLLDALCEDAHGKIFVLFGINEISFAPEYFARLYGGVLDAVQEREPWAEIYVMSLTPLTKTMNDDEEHPYFTMDAVLAYNAALRQLSQERGCHYIDLVEALAGEDGFLPEDGSTDGIHLTRDGYHAWADYLRTHV